MRIQTEPVLILGYGEWKDVIGDSAKRADGSESEYVDVYDEGAGETQRCTIGSGVNGNRPDVLKRGKLEGELVPRGSGKGGLKLVVYGFKTA